MPEPHAKPPGPNSRSIEIFKSATEEHQKLIKQILSDEREVQHLQRRPDIHANIYDHVRRLIK